MKNKAAEALLIIFLTGLYLAACSFFLAGRDIPFINGNKISVSFVEKDRLFDFGPAAHSAPADSLIRAYSADTVITAANNGVINLQIANMPEDSLKLREAVNLRLNTIFCCDSMKTESAVQRFMRNYLADESDRKKKIIKEELITFLNIKNLTNAYLFNPETAGVKPLDKFFRYLMQHKDSGIVRIVHYGDSQLEGDRVTSSLRDRLHGRFGGAGLGFIPLTDITDHLNLKRSHSGNWRRHTVFQNRFQNNFYGAAGIVFRFGYSRAGDDFTENSDSASHDSSGIQAVPQDVPVYTDRAYVNFNLAPYVEYTQVHLMYGRSQTRCRINVYAGDVLLQSDDLPETGSFEIFRLNIPANTRKFKLEFIASVSPDFYGLLIDGDHGVQIDNYALRGHSGDGLLLINPDYYALQLQKMNVRLIILQYGTNAVPYVRSEKACQWLEDMYVQVINKLKSAAPDASILFVGVGDMARRTEGGYSSYPMLPKIRDAEKNAALRTNSAYWDIFESMGGANSILTWAKERLAVMDGHLSPKGREVMAKEIFDALMTEYDLYRYKPNHKKPK